MAARHRPARLLHARAVRARLHRRRQRRAPAGDDPPRPDGQLRALHGHPDRALRRRVPALAGAASRRPCCRSPTATSTTRARCRRRCATPGCAPTSTSAPSRSAARSARRSCGRCRTCSSSATARPSSAPSALRRHREGDQGTVPLDEVVERLVAEAPSRGADGARGTAACWSARSALALSFRPSLMRRGRRDQVLVSATRAGVRRDRRDLDRGAGRRSSPAAWTTARAPRAAS